MYLNRLTLPQTSTVIALALGMFTLPSAPIYTHFSSAAVILFIALAFATRNIAAIGTAAAVLNIMGRFRILGGGWQDQHWVQWSSISALLTGHNIFDTSPIYNFSLSSYMPTGDLFGGFLIALGIQKYWLVWHVLNVGLVALPLLLSPSFATLLMFVAFSSIYPYVNYTTAGGTLEIAYALTIGAIALFRAHHLKTASLIVFAFAAMFRQPSVVVVPFLYLILWRERDQRRIAIFTVVLFLFGGIYILVNPFGAYHYLYQVWDGYHQELYNVNHGLADNYSISSIFHALGVPDDLNWYKWKAVYPLLTILGIGLLLATAWFRRKPEEILLLGVLASAAVYVLSRGYAQFGYTSTAFYPLVAFLYPADGLNPALGRRFASAVAMTLLWIGATPAFLYAGAVTIRMLDRFHPLPIVETAANFEVRSPSSEILIPRFDRWDENPRSFPLSSEVELRLAAPAYLKAVRLTGNRIPIQPLKGVFMPYPVEVQMRGAMTEGVIEAAEREGGQYSELTHFHNSATYCIWPVTIPLPSTPRPIAAIRLRPIKLYLDQQKWIVGDVELLGRR